MSLVASIRLRDLSALAWSSLRRNKLRSSLTVGAIGFSIAIMMFLVSLGFGLESLTLGGVENSPSLYSMTVTTASNELQPLTSTTYKKIKNINSVKNVFPELSLKGELSLGDQKAQVTVIGVDPGYLELDDATKVVLGHSFGKDDTQTMVVTTSFLTQVGLEKTKNPLVVFGVAFDPDDFPGVAAVQNVNVSGVVDTPASAVYVPRLYLESLLGNKVPHYENMKVTVSNLDQIEPVKNELVKYGLRVTAVSDTVQDIRKVFKWIRLVLGGLGLLAIFVASIGMFNTLTVSLLERTREIGIMKALGVRKSDISRLFMFEALMMGLLGGVLGILAALFLQRLTIFTLSVLASLAQTQKIPTIFLNPWYMLVAFMLFAGTIAGITGIYPARRAAKLNPIEAIKNE